MVLCAKEIEDSELENVSGGLAISSLIALVALITSCGGVGVAKFAYDSAMTDKEIVKLQNISNERVANINAQGIKDVQTIKSMENMAGYTLAAVVAGVGLVCFNKEIKTWWNDLFKGKGEAKNER